MTEGGTILASSTSPQLSCASRRRLPASPSQRAHLRLLPLLDRHMEAAQAAVASHFPSVQSGGLKDLTAKTSRYVWCEGVEGTTNSRICVYQTSLMLICAASSLPSP